MALYLGNQKVSLRSGQDPTFDYGFDSNGRLVFANKNATEINNFLNYDSTYSEILDLSNLSKMEKVAVNGTADRKMEGLKGLLVSPNAPFTGSSPQINASYTGLSKSALVSLFESAPYNVGYTKVGNPTIVDGVASGFSSIDYLQLNEQFDLSNALISSEIQTKISVPSSIKNTGEQILYFPFEGLYSGFRIYSNNRISWYIFSGRIVINSSITLTTGNNYFIKGTLVNKIATLYLKEEGQDWQILGTADCSQESVSGSSPVIIGTFAANHEQFFSGSIDLNETYIKVNGVPWFGPGATKNLVPDGTVVGDVIVKDGIASGFSGSGYLITSSQTKDITTCEWNLKFNTLKIPSANGFILGYKVHSGVIVTASKKIRVAWEDNTSTTLEKELNYVLSDDTDYVLNCVFNNTNRTATITLKNAGGTTLITETYSDVSYKKLDNYFWIGMRGGSSYTNNYWRGSIDLNNTYIKVGSYYLYRGMVPMTKTCSIVGAMGTADLTQEDKNIILNKGWSLIVQ